MQNDLRDRDSGEARIVGDFDKVGRENGAKECPDRGIYNSTYDAVILEKGDISQAVRSYADVTRGNV